MAGSVEMGIGVEVMGEETMVVVLVLRESEESVPDGNGVVV